MLDNMASKELMSSCLQMESQRQARLAWRTPTIAVLSLSSTRSGLFQSPTEGMYGFTGAPGMCLIGASC